MAGRLTPREQEYKILVEQLDALEQDIDAARAAARHAESGMALSWRHERETSHPAHGEDVGLANGAHVLVRQIEPGDLHELEVAFERLGALSRYRRFRARVEHLSRQQLTAVTGVDHHSEEVLVALDPISGAGVGMAHYMRDPDDPTRAEFDCTVLDAWQRQRVGTVLAERVAARAAAAGIQRLTAHILLGNEPGRHLVDHIAEEVAERRDGGVLEVTARLRPRSGLI